MPKKKRRLDPVHRAICAVSPIRIGAEWFKVTVFPEGEWKDDNDIRGVCDYANREIRIRSEQNVGPDAVDTLLHECLHAVINDRAFGKFDAEDIADRGKYADLGELFVKAAEQGLINLFMDNPKLLSLFVKWWNPLLRRKERK
jgi:hypothetical protein